MSPCCCELRVSGAQDQGNFTYLLVVYFWLLLWLLLVYFRLMFMLIKMRVKEVIILCLAIEIVQCSPEDTFHEELYLKHLPSGHVYAHFQFTTTWNTSLGDENACMFPLKSVTCPIT